MGNNLNGELSGDTRDGSRDIDCIMKLSNNFEAIYDILIESGEYREFTRANSYADNISVKFVPQTNYYDDVVKNIAKVVCKDDRDKVIQYNSREFFERLAGSDNTFSYDYRLIFNGEPVWYRVRIRRSHDDDGTNHMLVGVFNVDSEVKEREQRQSQLEQALDDARAANKAKTFFLNNMSHDIRTPMNAIIGFSKLAHDNIDDKAKVEEYLSKISQSSDFLLSLINEVLDMSRIESGEMQLNEKKESLPEIIDSIRDIVTPDISAKNIEFTVDAGLVRDTDIFCDKLRLNQVLLNVVSNAVKYTQPGGRVSLSVTQKPTFKMGYGNYEFEIKDTGIGMSQEFVDKIYEPFVRAKNSTLSGVSGTGLGMTITRKIVEMMEGNINIDSVENLGTCVTISFDFKCAEPNTQDTVDGDAANEHVNFMTYKGKRILLVEDNELNREIAEEVLSDGGLIVNSVCDGIDAVELLKTEAINDYDMVLMDIQMPIMDGYEATRQIRTLPSAAAGTIPIIAMTANAFEEDRAAALEAGMNEHITKPIKTDVLYTVLKRFL